MKAHVALAAVVAVAAAIGEARAAAIVEPSVGIESPAAEACSLAGRSGDEPLPVLVEVDPAAEGAAAAFSPLLTCAKSRSLEIIVRLVPPVDWQKASDPYAALEPWLRSLDRFLQKHAARIGAFELGERPEKSFEPKAYAFLVEKVGTLLRSLDPGARLVFGALGAGSEAWLREIPPQRLAPYLQAIALQGPLDLVPYVTRLSQDYPAAATWLHVQPGVEGGAFLHRMVEARSAGVRIVFASASGPADPRPAASAPRTAGNLGRALPARFIVDREPPAVTVRGAATPFAWFMDPLGPERAFILEPAGGDALPHPIDIVAPAIAVRQARAFELASGDEVQVPRLAPGEGGEGTQMTIAPAAGPVLIRYVAESGPRGAAETVGVTAEYEPSAEEIIARMRAFEAGEARSLTNYTAKATLSYHYRAEALNEAVDSSSVNRFYWRNGVGEYEETDLFINGAHWRGPAPSLPFVQAQKVKEVPIDIRLDTSYTYHLDGREAIDGHPCFAISFEPAAADASLYTGRVWVDVKSFARRKVRLVQHGLREPITSKADEIEYGDVEGPERTYWLPLKGSGQMVFTVVGRIVVVERRVVYEDFQINGGGFEEGRLQAYASGHPMLRDDDKGLSQLLKQPDGSRVAVSESLENTAYFGGESFDAQPHIGTPFAGMNYFNFDWRHTGTQVDVAFAGILLVAVWTDPRLGSSRWELSTEGRFIGLPSRLKRQTDIGPGNGEDVRILEEVGLVTLGHPLTTFSKIEIQTGFAFDGYQHDPGTDPNYVLPRDGITVTEMGQWRYHRSGYNLSLWLGASHRFGWEDWGLHALVTNKTIESVSGKAGDDNYQKWGFDGVKSFYTGKLQKLSVNVSVSAGRGLDHFSRFEIGEFGVGGFSKVSVRGYNGADVTYERGARAGAAYQFALPRGGVSLELGAEAALLENGQDFVFHRPGDREYIAGGGFGVSWNGPWGTLMSLRSAWALGSSLEVHGSSAASRFVIIKTFGRSPFGHGSRPGEPQPPAVPAPVVSSPDGSGR